MIHALKTIGEYMQEKTDESLLSQVVENPDSNGKYKKVLVIVFKEENNNIVFDRLRVEEFSVSNLDKYAYKKGSPRGGDLTPTSKITELEKTFERIQKPLEKLCKKLKGNNDTERIILGIYKNFQQDEVSKAIYEGIEGKEYSGSAILTIAYKKDGNSKLKYVGDFQEFVKALMEKYEKKFYYRSSYSKSEKKSVGKNNVCYICSKQSKQTYGYVGTFSFYTLDKPGFTSGGFNRGQAWKNYPVCSECAKILDLGKKYLKNNLSARFCGINYFIIPKTIFSSDREDRDDMFSILEQLENHKNMSLEKDTKTAIESSQNDLFEAMSHFHNYANFNLMFYEEQNSAFRILLYIEDVLPSYIRQIFEAKDSVDEEEIFKGLKGKDGEFFSLNFKFNLISDFFYVEQSNKPNYTKQFLEITNSIFRGEKISYQILIDRFISHIQNKFANNESISYDCLKALMILKMLKKLNLLEEINKEVTKLPKIKSHYKTQIKEYLEEHSDVYNSDSKRTVFLMGVYAQNLINKQINDKREMGYTKNISAPFLGRLNGLKLNKKLILRLYPEIKNKFNEYKINYYDELFEMIGLYNSKTNLEDISNDEISFYFATGMSQANKFKFKKNEGVE